LLVLIESVGDLSKVGTSSAAAFFSPIELGP
jgi:hypothetical protein